MRVAIATDRDAVASGFGCCAFWTIFDINEDGIHQRLLVPNPGAGHAYWADLFRRNAVSCVVVGRMGEHARAELRAVGVRPVLGVRGSIDDALRRLAAGEIDTGEGEACPVPAADCGCVEHG